MQKHRDVPAFAGADGRVVRNEVGFQSQPVNLPTHRNRSRKNKDTPPAMTPRNFTFFPAAQSSVLQPFQGFVTFAF